MMRKRIQSVSIVLMLVLLLAACDKRRNQIISNILVSPTATETQAPPTETPAPTLTPEPTLTPTPFVTVDTLDLLIFGDFDKAEHDIRQRMENAADPVDTVRALTDLMESAYHQSDYERCMDIMSEIRETLPAIPYRPQAVISKAYYLNARCAASLELWKEEIDSIEKYLEYRPDSPILSEAVADAAYAYQTLEDYEMFRKYIEVSAAHNETELNDYQKLDYALSFSAEGNRDEAIRQLTDLYNSSSDETIKAAADYYLGTIYEEMELRDQVIARFQDAVNNYPKTYYSYLALIWLLDNGQTVSDFQRGLINYYRGQYSLANDAFHRYVKAEPGNDGSSWYFIGICQMNIADYENAEASFQRLIENYPENRYYVSSWDELAYVQWFYMDKYKKGAETLTNYVSRHPDQADSASFLYEAGRILERGNYLSDASKTWARLIDEYPLYENSKRALFLAAISSYRIGDHETALAHLNRLLLVSGIPEDQAQANFWMGKIYSARGDEYNMKKYLEKAAEISKTGYYSLRAAELLQGKDYLETAGNYDFEIDLDSERQVADQWMMLTFSLDSDKLYDASPYRRDPDYLKGCEYYSLGQYAEAALAFESVRGKLTEDPASAYVFLDEMVDKKMYSVAAYTSRQILSSAGLYENDRTLEVPNYFNHIRFGPWYYEYVKPAAEEYGISPFILYALMKQESMYNPWAGSGAGALGLMQIMPATGDEIAKTLHWPPDYSVSDLLRVQVSVNFAASYLRRVRSYFDQSNAAMVASYNGGSGNTQIWLNSSDNDPDLLYEVVRYQETRDYMHNIYCNAKIYEWLYAK